jgi:hypothetical protein
MIFKRTVYNCREATLLSIKREEGNITLHERVKLWYHLLACDPCRDFIRQSAQINQAGKNLRDLLSTHPPFELSHTMRVKIQAEIDKELE